MSAAPVTGRERVAPGGNQAAFLLMLAVAVSWLDRALPGILIEPMRRDLGLDDTQVSLLTGLSFSICYGLAAYPVGWLADRGNRARLLAGCVLLWCAATVGFGLAGGLALLFLCRMGVGLGEAAIVPIGLSLLADSFPAAKLPRASALLQVGPPIGIVAALVGGSALTQWLDARDPVATFGLSAWRLTFIAAGAIGLLLVPWLALLREPRRAARIPSLAGSGSAHPGADTSDLATGIVAYVRQTRRFVVPLLAGVGLFNLYVAGYLGWLAPFFQRSFGWSLAKTGQLSGLAVILTGVLGAVAAGALTPALTRRAGRNVVMSFLIVLTIAIAPLSIAAPLLPDARLAYAAVVAQLLLTFAAGALIPAAIVNAAPADMRARFTALVVFLGSVIGGALGPTAFALLTDHVFGAADRLRWSLASGSAAVFAAVIPLWLVAARAFPRAVAAAQAADAESSPRLRPIARSAAGVAA